MIERKENYPDKERLWGAEDEDSIFVSLAEILIERGIKGIELARFTRESDGGDYIAISIYAERDSRAAVFMNVISELEEVKILRSATLHDYSAYMPSFDDVNLEEFKDENLQHRLRALYCKNKIAEIEKWPDEEEAEQWEDSSKTGNLTHYTEEMEEYLRFSTPNTVPDSNEIRNLVEIIVDSQGIPRKEKEVKEEVIVVNSKATLRASEVAELDPYNIRNKPAIEAASELLKEENPQEIMEDYIPYSEFVPESSNILLAEIMQEKGYPDINIKDLPNGNKEVYFDHYGDTEITYWNVSKLPDMQILEEITSGDLNYEKPNFGGAIYFTDRIVQKRLTGLLYEIQANVYERSLADQKFVDEKVKRELMLKEYEALEAKYSLPTKKELSDWINILLEAYLIKK